MKSLTAVASAAVGGLMLVWSAPAVRAQGAAALPEQVGRVASIASGSIAGVVQDESGAPVSGAMVSALGATTAFAVTDRSGRFILHTLSPGPYLVRAHSSGFIASRGQIIEVRPSNRTSSAIALRHAGPAAAPKVLTAGVNAPVASPGPADGDPAAEPATSDANHGEVAWRLRHSRRSILKDATIPEEILADASPEPQGAFGTTGALERAVGTPARFASNLFGGTPFSGQFNLLTTGSFDTPQQLFTTDNLAGSIAYVSLGAPVGSQADWTMRGAVSQGAIASWIVSGAYTTRAPARHRYELGLSYAAQRYEGANPAVLVGVAEAGREVGTIYGFDTFAVTDAVSLTYGARVARYTYVADRALVSPRVGVTIAPVGQRFRITALASQRELAPGAEEFLPPSDSSIWLPPERTFSSLASSRPMQAERTDHIEGGIERDLAGSSTVSFRAFRQHVANQLVTMFGIDMPGHPARELAHYFVSNSGDVDATGWTAGFRTAVGGRVHGSIEYSLVQANWAPSGDLQYLVLFAPSAIRLESERIHDIATSLETDVPETSTRLVVLYRVSNAFAHRDPMGDHPMLDSRFDVQVHQSLPFMNFSSAQWEALLAVDNFFHETAADQSVYDELLVVRPPKRVIGGLTLRF